jgi:hypothetical protein
MMAGIVHPWEIARGFRAPQTLDKVPGQIEWVRHILMSYTEALRNVEIYEAVFFSMFQLKCRILSRGPSQRDGITRQILG